MDPNALVGQQIDRYLIKKHIDRGGMADLYLGYDVDLDRQVALKVILPSLAQIPEFGARFRREARATARVNHPHVVQIYTNGVTQDNRPYIALEYIVGGSLADHIDSLNKMGKRMPEMAALNIARDIALGLQAAHKAGIIHRDLKPNNVLLRSDGTAVVSDLGIAAVLYETTRLTQTGTFQGTPQYIAPEQVRSDVSVDARSDIYSLGVILYELLTGVTPFDADSPWGIVHQHIYEPPPLDQLRSDVSKPVIMVVTTCLQKEPDQRYQTAGKLIEAIDQVLGAKGISRKMSRAALSQPIATDSRSMVSQRSMQNVGVPLDNMKPLVIKSLYIIVPLVLLGILFVVFLPSGPKTPPVIAPNTEEANVASEAVVISIPSTEIALRLTSTRAPTYSPALIDPVPSPIETTTPVPKVMYANYRLENSANAVLDFELPPVGDLILGGIPFSLSEEVFKSQASGGPNEQYPTSVLLPITVPSAFRVHLLINSGNAFIRYNGAIIGSVSVYCDEEPINIADLRLGSDIREWHVANNVVSSATNVVNVWQDGVGHIDLLSLDLPSACRQSRLTGIEIKDLSINNVNSFDPAVILVGITVEHYQ